MHLSVFDRKVKKKNYLILGVWLFPVDCIGSWVALQWPVCVCVFVCVWTGYRLPSEKRSWGNSQLPCIVAANTQSTQPGPPAGPVPPPCGPVLSLSISFFLFLLLSVCSDNCDPALCIITSPPPTKKKKPTSSLLSFWERTHCVESENPI